MNLERGLRRVVVVVSAAVGLATGLVVGSESRQAWHYQTQRAAWAQFERDYFAWVVRQPGWIPLVPDAKGQEICQRVQQLRGPRQPPGTALYGRALIERLLNDPDFAGLPPREQRRFKEFLRQCVADSSAFQRLPLAQQTAVLDQIVLPRLPWIWDSRLRLSHEAAWNEEGRYRSRYARLTGYEGPWDRPSPDGRVLPWEWPFALSALLAGAIVVAVTAVPWGVFYLVRWIVQGFVASRDAPP